MVEQKPHTEEAAKSNTKQLDWMADDYGMEITEGVKFDPERDYIFELTDIKREAGTNNDGKEFQKLNLFWTEEDSGVTIRQGHFLNAKITKNKDAPEKSHSLVKLANALGYKVDIGDKNVHPKNFLRNGMKIVARVVDQIDRKTKEKTGFSEIDLASIRPHGKKAQQTLPATDQKEIDKWQDEVTKGKFPSPEAFMQNLASAGRFPEIAPFMEATKAKKITFG